MGSDGEFMIGLREKLLAGYLGLILFLALTAGLTLYTTVQRESDARRMLETNYHTLRLTRNLEKELYRMGVAAAGETGHDGAGTHSTEEIDTAIRKDFRLLISASTGSLRTRVQTASAAYESWYQRLQKVLQISSLSERHGAYDYTLAAPLTRILMTLDGLVGENIAAMQRMTEISRDDAVRNYDLIGAILLCALLFGGVFLMMISRQILVPLRALTASARQIQEGKPAPRVVTQSKDEIGQLANVFNAMAAALADLRKSEQERFHRTQATTQLAIDSLPHAVAIFSPEGRVEMANSTAERLFSLRAGTRLGELQQRWLVSLVEQVLHHHQRVEPAGYDAAVQVFDRSRELFFLPNAIPLLDSGNHLVGVTVVLVDATQLRQVDEAKSGLLSSVSHELKTPLTSIQMSIHLLLEDAALRLTPRQVELLEAARDDSNRLHDLITSLLDAQRREKRGA